MSSFKWEYEWNLIFNNDPMPTVARDTPDPRTAAIDLAIRK